MEKVDEVILHTKFVNLAEKCDTLEKMQKFCKAFMTKYPEETVKNTPREYSLKLDYDTVWVNPVHDKKQTFKSSVAVSDHGFSISSAEHQLMIENAKQEIVYDLIRKALNAGGVEWITRRDHHSMSTIYTGYMTVNIGEKK